MIEGISLYDFDGVVSTGKFYLRPGDVIVTGRCVDEAQIVLGMLSKLGVDMIPVYFNPIMLKDRGENTEKARTISAYHKVSICKSMLANGVKIRDCYEDDPLQLQIIKSCIRGLKIHFVENGEINVHYSSDGRGNGGAECR